MALCATLLIATVSAQDLEPRRWTPIPLDLNVLGVGYGYSSADIEFDPVLKVEDADMDLHVVGASYVTSFKIADRLARFDLTVPWANGKWQGQLDGEPAEVQRVGLVDPRLRLSINLIGTPAEGAKKLREYLGQKKSNTVVGAALAVTVPVGEYQEDKLINLGGNRYVIRPQVGLVHTDGSWSYELTGSVLFFTENDDFYNGKKRKQDPLFAVQTHLIKSFEQGRWASLSAGYSWGGKSEINGVKKDDKKHNFLSAISFGMPISRTQSIKVAYLYTQTNAKTGLDSDSLLLAWTTLF